MSAQYTHPDLYLYAVSALIEYGGVCQCGRCSEMYTAFFGKCTDGDTMPVSTLTHPELAMLVRALNFARDSDTLSETATTAALRHVGYLPSIRPEEYRLLRDYACKAEPANDMQRALLLAFESLGEQMKNSSETLMLSVETGEQFGRLLRAGPPPAREHVSAHTALVNRLTARPARMPTPTGRAASA